MAAGRQLNNNDAKHELKKIQERMAVINAQLQRESLNENMANALSKELMKISRQAGALARAVRRNRAVTLRKSGRGREPVLQVLQVLMVQ